jgi:outer membrane lipoprotein SlyB
MSQAFQPGQVAQSPAKRNALFAGAAAALVAVGVAAGMVMRPATPSAEAETAAAVTTPVTGQAGVGASNMDALPVTPNTLAAVSPPPSTQTPQAGAVPHYGSGQSAVTPAPSNPAPVQSRPPVVTSTAPIPAQQARQVAVCNTCGVVESVRAVKQKGEGTGLGAVAGGALGGLLGNQIGGGNGRTAMTVLGAVGGGLAGHETEKQVRATTSYDVTVRMQNGTLRHLSRANPPAVGEQVVVQGQSMRAATARDLENRTISTGG